MNLIKICLFSFIICLFTVPVLSQTSVQPPKLDENSVVIDSSGMKYPYLVWRKMVSSGDYSVTSIRDKGRLAGEFLLVKQTEEMKLKRYETMSKPRETDYFKTGARLSNFNLKDLNNKKYKLKDLSGKVVVLNFWFINCSPCRKEIPELNQLVEKYKNNSDVVFLAIALDNYQALEDFLKTNPYNYNIVADGHYDAQMYKVHLFPTHVVLDRNANIIFHTNGLAPNTVYWVEKVIKEGLKSTVSANPS